MDTELDIAQARVLQSNVTDLYGVNRHGKFDCCSVQETIAGPQDCPLFDSVYRYDTTGAGPFEVTGIAGREIDDCTAFLAVTEIQQCFAAARSASN